MTEARLLSRSSFDMSLRVWSDDLPLRPIVGKIDSDESHFHVKGEPIAVSGYLAGKLAKRHYAALANATARQEDDVRIWLARTSAELAEQEELSRVLVNGQAEAVFWIAVFGDAPSPGPLLQEDVVTSLVNRGARILIENYTQDGPDCPSKTWLQRQPGLVRSTS